LTAKDVTPSTAKDVTFLGSRRQPKKVIYLAGINRQGNAYRQQKNIIDINAHSITKSMQIYDPNINIIDIMHEGV